MLQKLETEVRKLSEEAEREHEWRTTAEAGREAARTEAAGLREKLGAARRRMLRDVECNTSREEWFAMERYAFVGGGSG